MSELWMGGALLGLLAACWGRIKDLAWRFVGLLIIRTKLEGDASVAILYHCWTKMKRSRTGDRRFGSIQEFVRPVKRHLVVGYEDIGVQSVVFWQGWRPLLASFDAGDSNKPALSCGVNLSFIRGMFNLEKLLIESIDALNEWRHKGNHSRFRVDKRYGMGSMRRRGFGEGKDKSPSYMAGEVGRERTNPDRRFLKWKRTELGADDGDGDPWGCLAFPKDIEVVMDEAKRWLASEKWYREKKIPWRRGFLLYGRPGTGKTSLVRALAQDMDLPVVCFDLASMSNEEFYSSWRQLMQDAPCVALLEDVDVVFQGRENRLGDEGGGLTFDCLLNCLSGIESADGVLVFVTTNRIEDLDQALGVSETGDSMGMSTRPGRIDRAVELGTLDEDCRRRIAERVLIDCQEDIDRLVEEGDGMTGAQFVDLCANLALGKYWEGSNHEAMDSARG